MRSPPTQIISMSANSRDPIAIWPKSSAALDKERPPAVQPALVLRLNDGAENGELAEMNPDIGAVFLGLSYNPKASSSTIQTFEKLIRRWL